MRTGTVLYFSDDGGSAVIWCDTPHVPPLCRAYRTDFPLCWPYMAIGAAVRFVAHGQGRVTRAVALLPCDSGMTLLEQAVTAHDTRCAPLTLRP